MTEEREMTPQNAPVGAEIEQSYNLYLIFIGSIR